MIKKRICALILCALFLGTTIVMSACNKDKPNTSAPSGGVQLGENEAIYKVAVVDGLGNPYTEKVIVKFMQNGAQVAMATVNKEGVAEKILTKGDYTVEVTSTVSDADCWYDTTNAKLTAETNETEILMAFAAGGDGQSLSATSPVTNSVKDYTVYTAFDGSTYVKLDAEDRTYVLFTPSEVGEYEVSVSGDTAELGCYGSPHYVQSFSTEEVVDNKFTFTIRAGMIGTGSAGTTTMVIGLDANEGAEGAVLNINRIGEPAWSIDGEPWSTYQASSEINPYTLPDGTVLKEFDLTAATDAYKLVLNDKDGYYHLNAADGPLVFAQLDQAVYGISMKVMVGEIVYQDGVLMQSGTAPFRYMYNNGQDDFFKEDYTDMMRQYVTNRDKASGVYPLTKDLHYAIRMGTDFMGWCKTENINYLFRDVANVNNEHTWMFLLCYADGDIPEPDDTDPTKPGETTKPEINPTTPGTTKPTTTNPSTEPKPDNQDKPASKPVEDYKDEPVVIVPEDNGDGTLKFNVQVKANHLAYYHLPRVADTTLKISSKNVYVIYNGKTYEPKNGVVTISGLVCDNWNPVLLAIGNKGTADETFNAVLSYPAGHVMNPITLKKGSNSTDIKANNEEGVHYTFKADKSGVLTITLDSISGKAKGDIVVTNESNHSQTVSLQESEDGKTVKIDVSAGDIISVNIGVLPNETYRYPAATIKTTVTIE